MFFVLSVYVYRYLFKYFVIVFIASHVLFNVVHLTLYTDTVYRVCFVYSIHTMSINALYFRARTSDLDL